MDWIISTSISGKCGSAASRRPCSANLFRRSRAANCRRKFVSASPRSTAASGRLRTPRSTASSLLLRRGMNIARKDGLISVVPYFPMLRETNVRTGFVEAKQFRELLKHLPAHVHPLMVFLFTTGCRIGAAVSITWDTVSTDCTKMFLPPNICKNKEPITLALTSELVALLKAATRKQFRQGDAPVFDATNLRREWHKAVVAAGMPNLIIHDLRRSGARDADWRLEDPKRVYPLRHRGRG